MSICGTFRISRIRELAPGIFDMSFCAPEMARMAKAGQFVHIACGEGNLLRRPISICAVSGAYIRVVFAVKGSGTKYLAARKAGEMLDVLGPLGNGFDLSDTTGRAMLIGGGIGVFPLYETAKPFAGRAEVILGFRSAEQAVLMEEFAGNGAEVRVATDDGSLGVKGLVTDLARGVIAQQRPDIIYACGPMPMLKGVAALADEFGIRAQVSMEERMGCGLGACLVCNCKVKRAGAEGYARVCKDGPVFDAKEVIFL